MVKIVRHNTGGGTTPAVSQATPTPTPQSPDTLAAFEARVAKTFVRLVRAFEDGDEFMGIDLGRELPRELWLRVLSAEDVSTAFGGHRRLRLTWELDEKDDDLLWVVISADGVELGRREFENFLDESRWTRTGLVWLAEKLGVDGPAGQPIREAMPRK